MLELHFRLFTALCAQFLEPGQFGVRAVPGSLCFCLQAGNLLFGTTIEFGLQSCQPVDLLSSSLTGFLLGLLFQLAAAVRFVTRLADGPALV